MTARDGCFTVVYLIMEWPEKTVLKLIEVYKTKLLLWDPKHKDHFKKNLKEDAWREIGVHMNMSADCCKKMLCMLASHRHGKNKIKSSTCAGKGRDEICVSRWFAYEAFKFLEDRDVPRMRLATEPYEISEIEDGIDAGVMPSAQSDQEATQMEQDTITSSTTKPTERGKRKADDISSTMISSAFEILKTATKKLY